MTGESPNPFASPSANTTDSNNPEERNRTVDFVPILIRWERLRIVYNLILVPFVLLAALIFAGIGPFEIDLIVSTIACGLLANLCFMLGPTLEAYGTYFKVWHPLMTVLLFIAGLFVTMLLSLIHI